MTHEEAKIVNHIVEAIEVSELLDADMLLAKAAIACRVEGHEGVLLMVLVGFVLRLSKDLHDARTRLLKVEQRTSTKERR